MLIDIVFFFKQKTAYEMRISDWSSDVCSSDLSSSRRAMKNMNSAKPSPPTIAINATPGPPPKVASTIASTHHDTASSNAPAVSESVQSAVSARPRSLMMRASIGTAVSAKHAPMNKDQLP